MSYLGHYAVLSTLTEAVMERGSSSIVQNACVDGKQVEPHPDSMHVIKVESLSVSYSKLFFIGTERPPPRAGLSQFEYLHISIIRTWRKVDRQNRMKVSVSTMLLT
mmetsp:Transcript_14360/g.21475  ORF Transcript_14360/g.21475 Transcript_14360/m.21475 type:complete len:106 (+) Transcript_14360:220-537(+)